MHTHTHAVSVHRAVHDARCVFLFIELDFIISANNRFVKVIVGVAHLIKKTSNQITLDTHCKLHHLLSGYEHLTRNVDIRCRFRLFVYLPACLAVCVHRIYVSIGLDGNKSIAISTIALNMRLLIISLKDVRTTSQFVCMYLRK